MIVLVGGHAGAGKSTLSAMLAHQHPNVTVFHLFREIEQMATSIAWNKEQKLRHWERLQRIWATRIDQVSLEKIVLIDMHYALQASHGSAVAFRKRGFIPGLDFQPAISNEVLTWWGEQEKLMGCVLIEVSSTHIRHRILDVPSLTEAIVAAEQVAERACWVTTLERARQWKASLTGGLFRNDSTLVELTDQFWDWVERNR